MPQDKFEHVADGLTAPAEETFAITPDDSADLPQITKALYIGEGGDITLRAARSDTDTVFRNLPTGAILDVRVSAVRAAGTTASDLVGLA
jgi:hypothetical protein